jgi:Inovirus Coat protein B
LKEIEMKKSLQMRLAAIPAVVMATAGSAMAAVPADVTTALTDLKADALTVATAVLVAIVAIYAFKFIRKGL